MDDAELQRLVEISQKQRGGKPAKYPLLEPFSGELEKLVENDVSLVVVRDWLENAKGVNVVLNTLRKFIILKLGREKYDSYLIRNGWAKNIHARTTARPPSDKAENGTRPKASRQATTTETKPTRPSEKLDIKNVSVGLGADETDLSDDMIDRFRNATKN